MAVPLVVAQTARLTLRELTLDDVDGLLEVLGDPVAMEHYPAQKTRVETEGWIAWARESYELNGFGLWAVVRTADGAFLGDCGPMLQPVEVELVPEIGYHIIRHEWGAAGELGFGRVVSIVAPENLASRRVAEKVHDTMRDFTWEKSRRAMRLFESRAP